MKLFFFQTQTPIPFTALIHQRTQSLASELLFTLWPEIAYVPITRLVIPGVVAFSAGGFLLPHHPECTDGAQEG